MRALRNIDEVAYVRFASVYRHFKDVEAFIDEINRMPAKDSDAVKTEGVEASGEGGNGQVGAEKAVENDPPGDPLDPGIKPASLMTSA